MTHSQSVPIVFHFESTDVRMLEVDGQIWFVAADVCNALGITTEQTRRLDEDEKGLRLTQTPSGEQQMVVINESGLYSLILGSRKPEAKKFKKWVTSEVLPAIRRTGRYEAVPEPKAPKALPGGLSKELRQAINRKAHALTLEAFDRLRDTLTREAESWAARGNSETDILLNLQHPAHTVGDLHLIHAADLWPITASVAGIHDLIESAVDAIHALEQQTGRQWYGRGSSAVK